MGAKDMNRYANKLGSVARTTIHSGFIAQDVEAAARSVGYDFSTVDVPKNEHDFYGLRYAEFVMPLVKAVQELSKQNEELRKLYEVQQQQLEFLMKQQ